MPRPQDPKNKRPRLFSYAGDLTKTWHVQFYAPTAAGELYRRRLKVEGATAADRHRAAALMIRVLETNLKAGAVVIPMAARRPKSNPGKAADELASMQGPAGALGFAIKLRAPYWRAASVQGFANISRRVGEWATVAGYERLPIAHMTPARWVAFFEWLQAVYVSRKTGRGVGGTALHNYAKRLSVLLRVLHGRGLYPHADALAGLSTPRKAPARNVAYTTPQRQALVPLLRAADPRLGLLVELMYYTLARPGELLQLRVEHVRADVIEIPAEIGKTGRARFPVITPPLRAVLDGIGVAAAPSTDFLIGAAGRPGPVATKPGRLSVAHTAVARAAGFGPDYTLYSWKHTGVVDMYRAGVKERYIKQQGGWQSSQQFDVYMRSLGLYAADELVAYAPTL